MESCSAAELLPKWSSKTESPGVKGRGGVATRGGAVTVSAQINFSMIRLSTKEHIAWHSHVRNLIFFFCLLLGTGAILAAITTLNAFGYLAGTETGFLISMSPITSMTYSPHLEALLSDAIASNSSNHSKPGALVTDEAPSQSQQIRFEETEPNLELDVSGPTAMADDDDDASALGEKEQYALRRPESTPVNFSTLSDVYHNMSDAELLRRASAESSKRRPTSVTPKVAYMFLTRGPLPLAALWERYFRGHGHHYSIYIHAHPNHHPNFPPDSVFYRRNIPSKEVIWGKVSVFAAERRLLANALIRDDANERFVLLSESCIPITPFLVAYNYFIRSEHSFVEAYTDMGRGGIGRYNRIKHRRKLEPEITPSQWRKGSQWFEMSRSLAVAVVGDLKYYPKYDTILCMKDCVCYIDEHYLPTVLTILAPRKLANRTAHYIDFHRSTAHPFQWEPAMVTAPALRKITMPNGIYTACKYNGVETHTCHMFARKFSPDTITPLLQLAATSFGIP